MDEPFGALDTIVRARLQDEFLRLQRDVGKTVIVVTHDIDEAIKVGVLFQHHAEFARDVDAFLSE